MTNLSITIALAAILGLAGAANAQTTTKKNGPGQSEYAPGQQAGPAKKSAPGQQMKQKNDPASPGASEYAPGQQGKSTTSATPSTKSKTKTN